DLRSAAHALHPVVIIGGEGLTEAVLRETDRSLAAHGLIKVRVHGDDRESRLEIYDALSKELGATQVQTIGKLLLIYRDGPAVLEDEDAADRLRATKSKAPKEAPAVEKPVRGAAPKTVVVRKPVSPTGRKPKPERLRVLGNERVTKGGLVKKSKARQASKKKLALG
ncbi:MAG: YhbY family RNA-binding protein, partial [Candidatus Protistobacter heckmanni]|nr:YhbY family RNA-binding protein [Candidatus Protistobacter heckmanni]